jgi:hypothetical protein
MRKPHKLREFLSPDKVAKLGNRVSEVHTSSFQDIRASGHWFQYKPKRVEGLNSARYYVKRDADNFIHEAGIPEQKKANYFLFHERFYEEFAEKDYCQIDLNAAYWVIALQKGYISFDTYKKFRDLKKARNMALGSLATKRHVNEYRSGKLIESNTVTKKTQTIFFDIANTCFNIMLNALKPHAGKTCFMWVDAIFCPEEIAKNVKDSLKNEGFGSSYDHINAILSDTKKVYIYMSNTKKVKTFNLPKKEFSNFNKLIT